MRNPLNSVKRTLAIGSSSVKNLQYLSLSFLLFFPILATSANLSESFSPDQIKLISQTPTMVNLSFCPSEIEQNEEDGFAGSQYPHLAVMPARGGVEVQIDKLQSHIANEAEIQRAISNVEINDLTPAQILKSIPTESVKLGAPAIMRGIRVVPFTVNPLILDEKTNEIHIIDELEFSLDFTSDENQVNLVNPDNRNKYSVYVNSILREVVVNPDALDEFPKRDDPDDSVLGGSIAYVIGDWNQVEELLQPLVEWRRRMGWTVDVIRVREADDRFTVKEAIQDAYDNWDNPPEYVVIVGDGPGLENNPYTIAYWNEQHGARYAYETDHHYCELEGDDLFPEACVGRLVFASIGMLADIVDKIIAYESDPFMGRNADERNWYKRAAVAATDNRSGLSSIDLCRWFKNIALRNDFTEVDEYFWNGQQLQRDPTQFINSELRDGVSFFLYRGWSHMNGFDPGDVDRINNGSKWPFVLLVTCNTGDYGQNVIDPHFSYTERFGYLYNGGAIGAVGAAGATHTAYNNILAAGVLQSIFVDDVKSQGWATMAGKMQLYSHYAERGDINHAENRNMEAWLTEFYIYNLIGDPAVKLYTDVPREIDVDFEAIIPVGASIYDVAIEYADGGQPAAGLDVCLYRAEQLQYVAITDAAGNARFQLNPEEMTEGEILLTVTGNNIKAMLDEIAVELADVFIGASDFWVDDDDEDESRGDNDGGANMGERIELRVEIINFGAERPDGGLFTLLTCEDAGIDMVLDTVRFDQAPRPNRAVEAVYVLDVDPAVNHGSEIPFILNTYTEDHHWLSSFVLPVMGPNIEFELIDWEDGRLIPGDTAVAFLFLANNGEKNSPAFTANIISLDDKIEVIQGVAEFDPIEVGEAIMSEREVEIFADWHYIKGNYAQMALVVESEEGFHDSTTFLIRVDRPRSDQPFGPDAHGYICIDNTDVTWGTYPRFDWVEIDTAFGGEGTPTRMVDRSEEDDKSIAVDLPFEFVYYGDVFDEITICTNGWLAMGDQSELISARNRHVPGAEAVPGMICPFWDDLITTSNNCIFTYFDEDNHTFIIEWSEMRKFGPQGPREPEETFEVILYDPEHYPTETGDGEFVFQYLNVVDNMSAFQVYDTPFATVGIASPDLTDGLEYTYWGDLTIGAAELSPQRAIKFTTNHDFPSGQIAGEVTEFGTNETLSGVQIVTSYGSSALTDDQGRFHIPETIVATNYEIFASLQFYNSAHLIDYAIHEGANNLNFQLRRPVLACDPDELLVDAENQQRVQTHVTLQNSGTGSLEFAVRLVSRQDDGNLNGGGRDNISWQPYATWPVGGAVNDNRINGIVRTEEYWIVTGGANGAEESYFYYFDDAGNYLRRNLQHVGSRYGIKDLEYCDGVLYAVSSDEYMVKIDPATGENLRSWEITDQLQSPRSLAIDPENNRVYMAGLSYGIYVMQFEQDSSLTWVKRVDFLDPRTDRAIHPYGMAFYPDDPDGYSLYMQTRDDPLIDPNIPDIALFKANPETEEIQFLTGFEDFNGQTVARGGLEITNLAEPMRWVMATVYDHIDGDFAAFVDLGLDLSWISFSPEAGTVASEDNVDINFDLATGSLASGLYRFDIQIIHNADPGLTVVPVSVSVTVDVDGSADETMPHIYSLGQNHPNPFNPVTTIDFSLAKAGAMSISVLDIQGRVVSQATTGHFDAGAHSIRFNAGELAAGVYFYRLDSEHFHAVRKMVLVK